MRIKYSSKSIIPILLTIVLSLQSGVLNSAAPQDLEDKHIRLAMRTIGHEILTMLSDSNSRVMPIEQSNHQFRISFERDLEFDPGQIAVVVDSIMKAKGISDHYFVETLSCDSLKVQHIYEFKKQTSSQSMACSVRSLPRACYVFQISLMDMDEKSPKEAILNDGTMWEKDADDGNSMLKYALLIVLLIGFIIYILRSQKKNDQATLPSNLLQLGNIQFDPKQMHIIKGSEKIELSNKESELLDLLYSNANTTLEREAILEKVWGDEGDYVGRTLDVFISKLRKKLEGDEAIRIVNIRGVGYKLILA